MPRHIIIKLLKTKDKRNFLKNKFFKEKKDALPSDK